MFTYFLGGLAGTRKIFLTVSASQTDYDLFVAAGSPVDPVEVEVTIQIATDMRASTTGNVGFDTGTGWVAGTVLKLINDGEIFGHGGAGGNVSTSGNPSNGEAGGDSMNLQYDITIDNTNGNIFSGGGGGGGGARLYVIANPSVHYATGGSGGGGAGLTASLGGTGVGEGGAYASEAPTPTNGSVGTSHAGGAGGAYGGGEITVPDDLSGEGGTGGGSGAAGSNGGAGLPQRAGSAVTSAGSGGAAGKAIELNGNVITWLGGNNGAQVKGAVS